MTNYAKIGVYKRLDPLLPTRRPLSPDFRLQVHNSVLLSASLGLIFLLDLMPTRWGLAANDPSWEQIDITLAR